MKAVFITFALFIASAVAQDQHELVLEKVNHPVPPQALEQSMIVKGRRAKLRQFPYQVGLMFDNGVGFEYTWCGGTLISDQWVLTAAHCIDGVLAVYVHLGAYDRTNRNEKGQIIIHVDKSNITVHENWDHDTFVNDIALIKLPSPIEFNDNMKPAKLPKMNGNYSDYVGVNVIASGWGKTKDSETIVVNKLRWIEVPIMPNAECRAYYNKPVVEKTNICLSPKKGMITCKGDSGGPIVLADGSNTLIGVTSFGLAASCERSSPSVYTRVTSYLDWIADHTGVVNK